VNDQDRFIALGVGGRNGVNIGGSGYGSTSSSTSSQDAAQRALLRIQNKLLGYFFV
jgi:hypothetical protein